MTHLQSALRLILATGAFFMLSAGAEAQSPIVYVSAGGNDANACTFAAPCRLLQRAVNVVPAGGVVQVLNSAGYGHVTITKSLTISGSGNVVALGHRIIVNSAGAVVVLRGLAMDGRGLGTGATGILISAAATVHIEDCEIARYTGRGIQVDSASELFVADTLSHDNGIDGLGVFAASNVTIDNSRFENNPNSGVFIAAEQSTITRSVMSRNDTGVYQSGGKMNVSWTTAADNYSYGYYVVDGQMELESSAAHGSTSGGSSAGLFVHSSSIAHISNSTFTFNTYGIYNAGTVVTRGNNTIWNNPSGTVFGNPLSPLGGV